VRTFVTAVVAFTLVLLLPIQAAASSSRAALHGSVPPWATTSGRVSAGNPNAPVNFRVYLSLQSGAQAFAAAVSDPRSTSYGRYLSPDAFNARYAPTASAVSAVSSWLQSQGLTVDFVPSNNHYVAAEGTVAQVAAAFGTSLNLYAVNGKTLRAPASELQIPAGLAGTIAGVLGIDQSESLFRTFNAPEPNAPPAGGFRNAPPCSAYWAEKTTANTTVGSGVYLPDYDGSERPFAPCGYAGAQLQGAYGLDAQIAAGYNGRGTTVAIIDAYASPTIEFDANHYFALHGLPVFEPGQFTQIVAPGIYRFPEGPVQHPQGWYGEETLDVEAVHTMAPGAKIVYVGSPNNFRDLDAALNHVVATRLATIVTNSYGFSTELLPPGYVQPVEDTLIQAAAEGIGVYFSSGDNGDETLGLATRTATVDWPAASPWVTAVGGTSLAVGAANNYLFETGWGTSRNRLDNGSKKCSGLLTATPVWCPIEKEVYLYGSGGGTSRIFAQPDYQAGVVPNALATRWSTTPARVVPDISAVGDPNTGMLVGQTQHFTDCASCYGEFRLGGTSLSSPLMAGMMAVAQQRKGSVIGFANPALYAISSGYNDIVDPAATVAVVRVDYVNSENATGGLLYSVRRMNVTWTLHTVAGYDDVTGLGTPTAGFFTNFGH
jgi:subtilase family serine protease